MQFDLYLAILAFASLASAQPKETKAYKALEIKGLSECAYSCLQWAAEYAGKCDASDPKCTCEAPLVDDFYVCTETKCGADEVDRGITIIDQYCTDAGFPDAEPKDDKPIDDKKVEDDDIVVPQQTPYYPANVTTVTSTDLVTVTKCEETACATIICIDISCETPIECEGLPCSTLTEVVTATTTICNESTVVPAPTIPVCEYGPCTEIPSNYTATTDHTEEPTITLTSTITVCEDEVCTTSVMTTTEMPTAKPTTEMPTSKSTSLKPSEKPTEKPSVKPTATSTVSPSQTSQVPSPDFTGSASAQSAAFGAIALAFLAFFL